MTDERLTKAVALKKRIEQLEGEFVRWNQAEKFAEDFIKVWREGKGNTNVDISYIDFDVMKALALNKIIKLLEEVREEYKNL